MPGFGSWMVGQRALGVLHAGLSFLGLAMMTVSLCWFVFNWIQNQQMPQSAGPYFWVAVTGIMLFVGAWFWSLVSSVALLRRVCANPPPAAGENVPPKLN